MRGERGDKNPALIWIVGAHFDELLHGRVPCKLRAKLGIGRSGLSLQHLGVFAICMHKEDFRQASERDSSQMDLPSGEISLSEAR